MTGAESLDAKIEELLQLLEDLREEKRECHSAQKALRKEREATERYLKTEGAKMIEDAVSRLVKEELDILGPQMRKHTNSIYDKINSETDKLINLCLGKEFSTDHKRIDLRPQLAEKLHVWIREIIRTEAPLL